jgi:uncharacterized protein
LRATGHRPWPLPDDSWRLAQTWEDLLAAHWPVSASALGALLPAGLEPDTFEGDAWLGILPFRLTGFRLKGLPPLPVLSMFPELNVRTYVTVRGKPGIFFLSLDAGRDWAVAAARRFYKLPYFRARMLIRGRAWIDFWSERVGDTARPRRFRARYRPVGEPFRAAAGTLEYFLMERYCLYTADKGHVLRAEAHHLPWLLRRAEAEIEENTMAPAAVALAGEPLLHFATRQDALVWPLRQADAASSDSASRT